METKEGPTSSAGWRRSQPIDFARARIKSIIGKIHACFFDTSAFVKRYIQEAGTDTVLDWCDRATEIGLSGIVLPEIISAFCRLHKRA